jgi:Arc/MetJ-type ribon-helix-helix transcriptional regulator
MQIHLSPEQEEFVRRGVASGRFKNVEEALEEAFSLCEEREHDHDFWSKSDWIVAAAGMAAVVAILKIAGTSLL